MSKTYKDAGVDVQAGDEFVHTIKEKVKTTFSKAVLNEIGAFGALYDARFPGMEEPVLVSSVDGVGTKLKVAFLMDRHDTVGQDIVNHCVNDIASLGAQPLFFLDYFAVGKLNPRIGESVLTGMVKACRENGCALVGGETAEMPGFYRDNEYDIAGTIVGVVEKKKIIDGRKVKAGDVLIALQSSGLHTNGYSLARTILFERYEADDFVEELDMPLGEALLAVHRSYLRAVRAVADFPETHAFAHVTGGGIVGNASRVLPKNLTLRIDWKQWQRPPLFTLIQQHGHVPEHDMRKAFNLGVGFIIVAARRGVKKIVEALSNVEEKPFVIGEVVER